MKKLFTLSLIVGAVALLSKCSPKTGKKLAQSEAKEKTKPNEPAAGDVVTNNVDVTLIAKEENGNEQQLAILKSLSTERIEKGQNLYESTCDKCHELYTPSKLSALQWIEIMKVMGPKAQIEEGPYMMISAYLVKNSKA